MIKCFSKLSTWKRFVKPEVLVAADASTVAPTSRSECDINAPTAPPLGFDSPL
jgi:hypothetical protein